MRRAAQFCMRRRLWTEEAGRPERREFAVVSVECIVELIAMIMYVLRALMES